eukprot:comp17489_c0_seq1/m.29645 comp17489_c0_seq1/g.29645  ORF comp17489_c0_seq1/g.29645 comp17489_c0_seq1/m.29645 type:complete len:366 (-) comp17489_c0_seq1:224-1321(-)
MAPRRKEQHTLRVVKVPPWQNPRNRLKRVDQTADRLHLERRPREIVRAHTRVEILDQHAQPIGDRVEGIVDESARAHQNHLVVEHIGALLQRVHAVMAHTQGHVHADRDDLADGRIHLAELAVLLAELFAPHIRIIQLVVDRIHKLETAVNHPRDLGPFLLGKPARRLDARDAVGHLCEHHQNDLGAVRKIHGEHADELLGVDEERDQGREQGAEECADQTRGNALECNTVRRIMATEQDGLRCKSHDPACVSNPRCPRHDHTEYHKCKAPDKEQHQIPGVVRRDVVVDDDPDRSSTACNRCRKDTQQRFAECVFDRAWLVDEDECNKDPDDLALDHEGIVVRDEECKCADDHTDRVLDHILHRI